MSVITELVEYARAQGCSDVHVAEDEPVRVRLSGALLPVATQLNGQQITIAIRSLCSEAQLAQLDAGRDLDFAFALANGARQRVNIYRQQGKLAAAIRLLNDRIPTIEELGLPAVITTLADAPRGLILITGPTGSGKSTTLAAMLEQINKTRAVHIITAEDPIEYVYTPDKAAIHQREVGRDVADFAAALRSALREDPDVILVGEMRDYETISAAVTAAETGHLVLSTLHTTGAAQTVDRIVDACPAEIQQQMRVQLSMILRGVVTQTLLPLAAGGGRVAATEVLTGTDAVLNLIRENKSYQLQSCMQSGAAAGMHTLDSNLAALVKSGSISRQSALAAAVYPAELAQLI